MSDPEIRVEQSAIEPGTSRPVRIKVPKKGETRSVGYEVTDDDGHTVQSEEFELPSDIDEIAYYVEAPSSAKATKLNLKVTVDGQEAMSSLDIGSSSSGYEAAKN